MNNIDRSIAPVIFTPSDVEAMKERVWKTSNGVDVYALDFSQYDVVRVSLVFRAGTKYQSKPFLANSTMTSLTEGTSSRTNKEISDVLDFYGIYYDVSIDRDYSVITMCCLSRFFDNAIEIFEDILLNPIFPEKELEVLKSKRKHALTLEREKVDYIALENFSKAIYGESHPYGSSYSESDYDNLTVADLHDFYKRFYLSNNMFCVVSGKLTVEEDNKISALCDKFPKMDFEIMDTSMITSTPRVVYLEKEGALQSAIKLGRRMFVKSNDDFIPMQFLTTILGGYFGSRLIKNIREDKGYTYSIFAGMVNMEDSGHFAITTEVASEFTDIAVEEIFKEMDILKNELVPHHEMDMVRNVIIGQVLRILDGPFGIADVTIENIQNESDNRSVGDMIRLINNITSEQLRDLARKYFVRDEMSLVIVGKK